MDFRLVEMTMLRWFFPIILSAGLLSAQIQVRWRCDPKDGKFATTLCANCKTFYCWDGEIFSEEDGYTPPPPEVLAYWEEVHRRSQQIRADLERRTQELRDAVKNGQQQSQRMNQERMQAHQQFMDNLNRRMAGSRSGMPTMPSSPRAGSNVLRAAPTNVFVEPAGPATAAMELVPCPRAKVSEIQVGMDRAAVEGILGTPHSSISVPDDDGLVEALSYTLEDHSTARIRIEKGKVASVKILD